MDKEGEFRGRGLPVGGHRPGIAQARHFHRCGGCGDRRDPEGPEQVCELLLLLLCCWFIGGQATPSSKNTRHSVIM